jgi:hypothetical protein
MQDKNMVSYLQEQKKIAVNAAIKQKTKGLLDEAEE